MMDQMTAPEQTANDAADANDQQQDGGALAAGRAHLEGSKANDGDTKDNAAPETGSEPAPAGDAVTVKPKRTSSSKKTTSEKPKNAPAGRSRGAAADKLKASDKQPEQAPADNTVDTTGDSPSIMRGGTKNVKITEEIILSRGGLNTQREEPYPFTDLPMSVRLADGSFKGPSFFIPKSDNPDQCIATARKRFRAEGKTAFVTRKTEEIVEGQEAKGKQPGQRIWKVEKGLLK
jgi:hypothetical protein